MTQILGKCLEVPIKINPDREIVQCDGLEFPWEWKATDGYFLIRIENNIICVGYVNEQHELNIEFRGKDPDTLTKEILRRDFLKKEHLSYISAEIVLANHCLVNGIEYIQR